MEVFDRESALRRFGGDEDRLGESLNAFVAAAEREIAALERAIEEKRAAATEGHARKLAAAAAELCAEGIANVSARMAAIGARGDLAEAGDLLAKLQMELEWLKRVLDENMCSGNL